MKQKGSALLVSLMVMVGLSLLGLGFVTLSETESAISINERNHTQTLAVAEAGARVVVQWFQDPAALNTQGLLPANANAIKTERNSGGYTGYYKPSGLLCDRPLGPDNPDRFFGDEDSADVMINRTTNAAFLDSFNSQLFSTTAEAGQIIDIRLYAPPIVSGVLTADPSGNNFWVGGVRHGVATIRVQAAKYPGGNPALTPIAVATVRMVVSPFPVPGPTGALQSQGTLDTTGSFNVNWGKMTSQRNLSVKRPMASIPWFNAYDMMHYEMGYDSSRVWQTGTTYQAQSIVRPTAARIAANPALSFHEYVVTATGTSGATEPTATGAGSWPTTAGGTVVNGGVTFRERPPTTRPIPTAGEDGSAWLYQIVGANITDPWFEVRAVEGIDEAGGTVPHPTDYDQPTDATVNTEYNWFQFQAFDERPERRRVIFPQFDYNFWKGVAIAGNGQGGVNYLRYDGVDSYTNGVSTKTFANWVNNNPGFYFFDSSNNLNPQNGGPGVLAADLKPCVFIEGFVFVNVNQFGTTGCQGPTGLFPQPGEPYRDIGYRRVAEVSGGVNVIGQYFVDAAGSPVTENALTNRWEWQDLAWSNGGAVKNGVFDVYVRQKTVTPDSGANKTAWFVVPYYPGCVPGTNAVLGANALACSEPHEPYLNLQYSGAATGIVVGWADPTTAGRAKRTVNGLRTGAAVSCTAASPLADCTSNMYDRDGGLVSLDPGLDGVIYNEGSFDTKGNQPYFGSIVLGNSTDIKGTANIYFDENLIKGNWPPPGIKLPRVYVSSTQTDQ